MRQERPLTTVAAGVAFGFAAHDFVYNQETLAIRAGLLNERIFFLPIVDNVDGFSYGFGTGDVVGIITGLIVIWPLIAERGK